MESNLEIFTENGYLVVHDALNSQDLEPLVNFIAEVVTKRAHEMFNTGTITDVYEDMPFEKRWYTILQECERENEVFGWHSLVYSEALFRLITNRKVLDIIETLIGAEIQFNGDFWVRPKLPNEKTYYPPLASRQCLHATHRTRFTSDCMAAISRCYCRKRCIAIPAKKPKRRTKRLSPR